MYGSTTYATSTGHVAISSVDNITYHSNPQSHNHSSSTYYYYGVRGSSGSWQTDKIEDKIEVNKEDISNIYNEIQDLKNKGEENMLETMKILDLYKKNRIAYINNEYNKEFDKLKNNNKMMKEYKDLVNTFEASLQQLYTSQFAEGQTESTVEKNTLALIDLSDEVAYKYEINENYYPEAAKELEEKKSEELAELDKNCAAAAAMLSICKTKDEVEDILKKYEIIKSGKLSLLDIK